MYKLNGPLSIVRFEHKRNLKFYFIQDANNQCTVQKENLCNPKAICNVQWYLGMTSQTKTVIVKKSKLGQRPT